MTATLVLFAMLSLIAEIIGTVGGFGSSVYFVPLASFFLPFEQVLGLTALFHLASNVSKIALFRKGIDLNLFIWLGLPSIVFVIIGGLMTSYFDGVLLTKILNIFLILFSLILIILKDFVIQPSHANSVVGGMLSGFTAGLLGTGGAIRGLTMASYNLQIEKFVATSALIDLGVDLSRTIVYFDKGYIIPSLYAKALILLVISIIGSYIGKQLLRHFSQTAFKRFSLFSILLIGIIGLISAFKIYF